MTSPYTISLHMTSQRTASPSGRMHPNPTRRAELRKADMHYNIDYYGGHGAPDNDRLVKEASWLSTQSWFESLRCVVTADVVSPFAPRWTARH